MSNRRKIIIVIALIVLFIVLTSGISFGSDSVQRGDRGEQVTKVQFILVSHGYVAVKATGYFDRRTDRAVRHWQHVNRLAVDGVVGPQTMGSLLASVQGATASKPAQRLNPPVESVEQIIRDVWPDTLEDEAVRIAKRESSLVPTAANSICFGLFQIYFAVHRAWLDDYGVFQPSDLFDPRTNATVALALYNEAKWVPWATG